MYKNEQIADTSFLSSIDFSQKSNNIHNIYSNEKLEQDEGIETSKMKNELDKLKRIHGINIQINNLIIRTKDRKKLFEEVCNIAVTYGRFKMSWISEIDEETKTFKSISWSGFETGYLSKIKKISVLKDAFGNGPSGLAMRHGTVVICNDVANDEMMKPWREQALKRGYMSSISLPIIIRHKTIGTFNLYSDEVNFFSLKEEVELLENITENISFSLESMLKEEEKNKAEEKNILHSNLLAAVEQSVIATDLSGKIIYWNKAAESTYGWKEEETIGKNISDLMLSDQSKEEGMAIMEQLAAGNSWSGELLLQRRNGDRFMAFISNSLFSNSQGELIGLIGVSIDITENIKAREELLRSNERYNLVAKATNDSIWELNILTGEITRTGDGFELLFGHSTEGTNLDNTYWINLIHPEDLKFVKETQEIAFKNVNEFNWTAEYRFLKSNGDYAFVNDRGFIVRNTEGKAIRMIGSTRDVSERKKHVEAIEDQNKKLIEIAWVQSHVVRAPLSRMMGIVNLLKEEELNSEEFKTWVDHFVKSSKELDAIIKNISNKTDAIDLSAS